MFKRKYGTFAPEPPKPVVISAPRLLNITDEQDVTIFGDAEVRTLRVKVTSGPINPVPGEMIVLRVVGVERRVWHP